VDPHCLVRQHAATALGRWKHDPRVESALLTAMQDYRSWVVDGTIKALGRLRTEAAVIPLRQALMKSDGSYRDASEALERIGTSSAVEALADALRHPLADVRSEAAWRLGRMKAVNVVDRLERLLEDPSEEVRRTVAFALKGIHSKRASGSPRRRGRRKK
jgi:HEAT repeat protein